MSFEMTTLGEFATVQGGYAYKSQDFKSTGEWSVLKIKNVRNGHVSYDDTTFVSTEVATATSKWTTKPGDILISMTGSGPSAPESLVGRAARVWKGEKSALINQRVGRLILKESSNIDLDFLFYLLSLKESQDFLVSNSTGSANQVNISAKTIESVPCPKIDHDASTDIASILLSLDGKIRLLRETNTTLEAIAQTLFKSWFVDFDPVHAKQQGREPEGMDSATAALFPDSFEESELGLVPKGWRVGTLGQIADTVRSQRQPSELSSDTNYVGLEHIPRRCLSLANWGSAVDLESAKSCFSKDDILFGKLRPYFHKVVIAPFAGVCSTDILVCQSKLQEYYGLVTMHLFSKTLIDYAERLSNGAKMPRINWKDLAAYTIVLPPQDVAESYRIAVDPLFQTMLANVQQAQTLASLRDTLLPRLISGQLRLPDAEALIEETTA